MVPVHHNALQPGDDDGGERPAPTVGDGERNHR